MRSNESSVLPPQVTQDIKVIVDYLWRDEERHYLESGYNKKHVFRVLKRLAAAVKDGP